MSMSIEDIINNIQEPKISRYGEKKEFAMRSHIYCIKEIPSNLIIRKIRLISKYELDLFLYANQSNISYIVDDINIGSRILSDNILYKVIGKILPDGRIRIYFNVD